MTPEMAFEAVLLSNDPEILRTLNRALSDLAICTKICFHVSQAHRAISEGGVDLVVIDLVDEPSHTLLREVWRSGLKQKPTIVGICSSDRSIPGVHVRLMKPITAEATQRCLKEAYSRMLVDYRRHARYALMTPVTAMDDANTHVRVTVMDIGYGGVGLRILQEPRIGQVLSFRLPLPGARRDIHIEARVLWTRDFGRTGCEFVRVPPVDLNILHDWLKERITVKKPSLLTSVP